MGGLVRVRVRSFGEFGKILGHELDIEVEGVYLRDLLRTLEERSRRQLKLLLSDGRISPRLSVLLNGLSVRLSAGSRAILCNGDVVSLLPPSAGG